MWTISYENGHHKKHSTFWAVKNLLMNLFSLGFRIGTQSNNRDGRVAGRVQGRVGGRVKVRSGEASGRASGWARAGESGWTSEGDEWRGELRGEWRGERSNRPGNSTFRYTKLKFWNMLNKLCMLYRGADKPLAQSGKEQATATEDFEFHISYL